jgi:aspartate/methionine/tyrosine aminotransferase
LRASPQALGADVRSFPRDQLRYRVVPRAAADAAGADTRLVTMTNRHNPSGRLTSRTTIEAVAERVRDCGATLLVDEVYAPFESDGRAGPGTAFGGVTAAGIEDVVVTNSLTKFFGLGTLRLGWLVGPATFVEQARSTWWHMPSTAGPSRRLARRVFANLDAVAAHSRERIRENHTLLADFVESRDDLDGFVPSGSTMAFVTHRTALGDEVTEAALDAGVLVVPGRFFHRPEGVRLTLGRPADEMRAALDALGEVFDALPEGDA